MICTGAPGLRHAPKCTHPEAVPHSFRSSSIMQGQWRGPGCSQPGFAGARRPARTRAQPPGHPGGRMASCQAPTQQQRGHRRGCGHSQSCRGPCAQAVAATLSRQCGTGLQAWPDADREAAAGVTCGSPDGGGRCAGACVQLLDTASAGLHRLQKAGPADVWEERNVHLSQCQLGLGDQGGSSRALAAGIGCANTRVSGCAAFILCAEAFARAWHVLQVQSMWACLDRPACAPCACSRGRDI